jgi:hypothetical protein
MFSFYCCRPDESKDYTVHRLILGTHTSDEQNHLVVACVQIPKEGTTNEAAQYEAERGGNTRLFIPLKVNILFWFLNKF